MDQLDLHEVERMFTDFRSLESQFWESKFEQEKEQFEEFKARFIPFHADLQGLKKKEAPFFNIFDVLKVSKYETRLHTPFLCHLLNPKASHEQGDLFLNAFFEQVLGLPFEYNNVTQFIITDELSIMNFGQMDIIMLFNYRGRAKAIVIENKIYAHDQPKQLERYYKYLTKSLRLASEDYWLFYLTPYCNSPTSFSIDPDLADSLRQESSLFEIGYYKHVIPWLHSCSKQVCASKVKHTLDQYLLTLSSL